MARIWEMFVEKTSLVLAFFVKKNGLEKLDVAPIGARVFRENRQKSDFVRRKKQSSAFYGLEQNECFRRTIFRLIFFVRRNIKKPPLREA